MRFRTTQLAASIIILLATAGTSRADNPVIEDPTSDPTETWIVGNSQTVTFDQKGGYTYKVKIYQTSNPSNELTTVTGSCSGPPSNAEVNVPATGGTKGSVLPCTIQVITYDMMGKQVGSATVGVNIETPS